jgi:hypothetical protein
MPTLGPLWIPALVIFTFMAFKDFKFEEDYRLAQSLVVTPAFLISMAEARPELPTILHKLVCL